MKTNMYRNLLLITVLIVFFPLVGSADVKPTHFLGFAVDGPKEAMIENIKSKGYVYNSDEDYFTGIYYGHPAYIFVKTRNNVVSRIIVYDILQRDAKEIKERFNTLYGRYQRNTRYVYLLKEDVRIPDEEDVAYEMKFHGKRYKAVFGQMRTNAEDSVTVQTRATRPLETRPVNFAALKTDSKQRRRRLHAKALPFANGAEQSENKSQVWFTISEKFGKFGLVLFYDNIKNLVD